MKGMKEAQILAIVKEPGQSPRVEPLFTNTLQAFQEAVDGYIETVGVKGDEFASLKASQIPAVLSLLGK